MNLLLENDIDISNYEKEIIVDLVMNFLNE